MTISQNGRGQFDAGYQGAAFGRRTRNFNPSNAGPNAVTIGSIDTLRRRARALSRNDSWAGAASDKLVSNMIGTGIQCKNTDAVAKGIRVAIAKLWKSWGRVADADSVLDWYGMQALVVREWDEAGECFARIRKRYLSDGLPVPMQVQLMEAEQCPASYYTTTSNGNDVRAGIEFNAIGSRVAYWFYKAHPNDYPGTLGATELVRVPADEVLHIYEPLRIGQLRGLPRQTSLLIKTWNLDKITDAVIERNLIQNLFAVFYTRKDFSPGGGSIITPETPTEDQPSSEYGAPPAAVPNLDLQPGSGQEVPAGYDVKFSTPPGAGNDFFQIIKSQLLAIAARHGVPYEVLTGDLANVSDRALKLILNEFRRFLEQRLWLYMIPMFCQPVREAFMDAGVLGGMIDAPGYASDREDYIDTIWVPEGWPYSHPVQDVDADIKAVQAGFKPRQAIILANGDDPEVVRTQRQEDNAQAEEDGEMLSTDLRFVSEKGVTQAKPDNSDFAKPVEEGEPVDPDAPPTGATQPGEDDNAPPPKPAPPA